MRGQGDKDWNALGASLYVASVEGDREENWVRASEIAEYTYCARAYWLSRVVGHGVPTDELHADQLAAGVAAHEAYGQAIVAHHVAQRRTRARLVLAAVVLLAFALGLVMLNRW